MRLFRDMRKRKWEISLNIESFSSRVLTPTEEVIQRIQSDPSVQGFLIVDSKGIIKRSSVDLSQALNYKVATKKLVTAARYVVKNLDPRDELKFLRVRTKNTEIMLGPENGDVLVVIQNLPFPLLKEAKDENFKKEWATKYISKNFFQWCHYKSEIEALEIQVFYKKVSNYLSTETFLAIC